MESAGSGHSSKPYAVFQLRSGRTERMRMLRRRALKSSTTSSIRAMRSSSDTLRGGRVSSLRTRHSTHSTLSSDSKRLMALLASSTNVPHSAQATVMVCTSPPNRSRIMFALIDCSWSPRSAHRTFRATYAPYLYCSSTVSYHQPPDQVVAVLPGLTHLGFVHAARWAHRLAIPHSRTVVFAGSYWRLPRPGCSDGLTKPVGVGERCPHVALPIFTVKAHKGRRLSPG